jgi:hypothetical protein
MIQYPKCGFTKCCIILRKESNITISCFLSTGKISDVERMLFLERDPCTHLDKIKTRKCTSRQGSPVVSNDVWDGRWWW